MAAAYDYDVALSFAGEQRAYVEAVAKSLSRSVAVVARTLRAVAFAALRVASSRIHAVLKSLLDLLVVVVAVAAIVPLCVGRRTGGNNYSENKSQRYQSATNSFFHHNRKYDRLACHRDQQSRRP